MKANGETTAMGAVDRFLLPLEERATRRYFRRCLFIPHRFRERLWPRVRRAGVVRLGPGGEPVGVAAGLEEWSHALAATREAFGLLRSTPLAGRRMRWILMRGDRPEAVERAVFFLFEAARTRPSAILKWGRRGSLRREHEALLRLGERLPAGLRESVPVPLAFGGAGDGEALVLPHLPGRSVYVEMQASLRPRHVVERHFEAAAAWLARLHNATRRGDRSFSHGDFWARNLLVDEQTGDPRGTVDWEHASEEAPPFEDLFHFPLTYGLNCLWSRYRRLPPEEAFQRTFLGDNAVSRAVGAYLRRYCAETGLDPGRLQSQFDLYLAERSRRGAMPGAIEGGLWPRFQAMLATSGRSVFSG